VRVILKATHRQRYAAPDLRRLPAVRGGSMDEKRTLIEILEEAGATEGNRDAPIVIMSD
jgi:hypothetical protein